MGLSPAPKPPLTAGRYQKHETNLSYEKETNLSYENVYCIFEIKRMDYIHDGIGVPNVGSGGYV